MRIRSRRSRFVAASAVAVVAAGAVGAAAWQLSAETRNPATQGSRAHELGAKSVAETRATEGERGNGPAVQDYENRAWPRQYVTVDRALASRAAFRALPKGVKAALPLASSWEEKGPFVPTVPEPLSVYQGRKPGSEHTNSGRVTHIALGHTCVPGDCVIYVGAAGGGVWSTPDGLAADPAWSPLTEAKIPTTSIGSIYVDPTDATGQTLYVGTGEENGSSDSEAGLGLYRSTDGGATWALVPGSFAVAKDRAIGAIAVDPTNANHILIGTGVARHGTASSFGGRFTPPGAPKVGLYESTDGGQTFKLRFSRISDKVDPASAGGNDATRGGVTKIVADRTGLAAGEPTRFYFSMFNWGLYRTTASGGAEHLFRSAAGGKPILSLAGPRTEFALAPLGNGKLRIYLADSDLGGTSRFYRTDDANRPANELVDQLRNLGWIELSNPNRGTPGFSSYDICPGQCVYDMWVESPAGKPDEVWIGGSMLYGEIFRDPPLSNGRAVQQSTNAGVDFDDMTADTQAKPDSIHPDQHAVAFAADGTAFEGSDGGVVRVLPGRADDSALCTAEWHLTGALLADCERWLDRVPTDVKNVNAGLRTLQFQHVTFNWDNPRGEVLGGTQDNGTWAGSGLDGATPSWFQTIFGDGGYTGFDRADPTIRYHTYFSASPDVNFHGNDPTKWLDISAPLILSGEASSFYAPIHADPVVGGTVFAGMQHVWRTLDHGGDEAFLQANCNELDAFYNGYPLGYDVCGDWVPLGGPAGSNTSGDLCGTEYGTSHTSPPGGCYITTIDRSETDNNTMWVGLRRGRVFVTHNARGVPASKVQFTRLDNDSTPFRFVSAIAVDENRVNTAYVSFSGYNAYTPTTPGHVFRVTYRASDGSVTWDDLSYNIGDQPVLDVEYDNETGDLWASTDWGVLRLPAGATAWESTPGLPPVATYSLTLSRTARVLYAGTHGRGVYRIELPAAG